MSTFTRIGIGLGYTLIFLVLTFFTVGAGEGTMLFFSALPTWIIFLGSLVLLSWVENKEVRQIIVGGMLFNYLMTGVIFWTVEAATDGLSSVTEYFRLEPYVLSFSMGWYLFGQLSFWGMFFRKTAHSAGGLL